MSRNRITKKQMEFLNALEKTMGNVSMAAELLRQSGMSVTREAHYRAMHANPKYAEAYNLLMEKNLDIAEGQLLKDVKKGNLKAVTYYLDSKGKDRGYGRKLELRGSDTDPVRFQQTTAKEIEEARQKMKEHFNK